MTLSVVIVNYNVKYFLRQCLTSVCGAHRQLGDGQPFDLEVWVVDNDSVDGSTDMVRESFPQVHLIANKENLGFAKANNQALQRCTGDYLLLLNPDTIVDADTFATCLDFMQSHSDCGGLGVKMVDGEGRYLKESKRGFPTPEAAFYKISGLIHIFPHSRRIAAYYMGHLDDNEVNAVEILCGAFLMFSREVYSRIGGLDERYFMYGEDIDFSWRIHQAGFTNYYLPSTHIIHYKGESTKKGSLNYVYTFYNAMSIFVQNYFTGRGAHFYRLLLHLAIWLRAALAGIERVARRVLVPVLDFLFAYGGFLALKHLWEQLKGVGGDYYPPTYSLVVIPLYILILMFSSWLAGGYDRPLRARRIVRGMGIGLLLLLAFYSLLDESQRYSRMLLLLGSAWTLLATLLVRLLLTLLHVKGYTFRRRTQGRILVIGSPEESTRVLTLCSAHGMAADSLSSTTDSSPSHLQDLIRIHHADEVVFCSRDLELRHIIDLMAQLRTTGVEYSIAPTDSDFIIGSNSVLTANPLYLATLDTISTDTARRTKRCLDLVTSLLAIVLSPLLFWPQKRKRTFFSHAFGVLSGQLTWVGYTGHRGIFSPASLLPSTTDDLAQRITLHYMRHYQASIDLTILLHNWNNL